MSPSRSMNVCEGKELVLNAFKSKDITLRLRYTCMPTCVLHEEHAKRKLHAVKIPSRIQILSMKK